MKRAHSVEFAELLGRLASSFEQGEPRLDAADEPLAREGLVWSLLYRPALDEHTRLLQRRPGWTEKTWPPLEETLAEQVVSQGPDLAPNELSRLLLDPVALRVLFEEIVETLPDCWLERMSEVGRVVMQADGVARPADKVVPAQVEKPKPRWSRRSWRTLAVASAAAVLLALGWWLWPSPSLHTERILQQASADLDEGRSAEAVALLEPLLSQPLSPALAARIRTLLERAGYESARRDLQLRHFSEVQGLVARLEHEQTASARLRNLALQAERGVPSEVSLDRLGLLVDQGYELDGSAPGKGLPSIDARTQHQEELLVAAVAAYPDDAVLRLNLGQFLLSLLELDRAGEQFRVALRLPGGEKDARLGLGLIAFEREDDAEALRQFEAVLRFDPKNNTAQVNAAVCLARLGRHDEARQLLRQALANIQDPKLREQIRRHLQRKGAAR